jgi:cytoskeletal protein CcmA (bactofilin family)
MFDQPADAASHGQSPAPAGMRELTPRPPARPGSPTLPTPPLPNAYPGYETSPLVAAAPVPEPDPDRPGPDDSVVARDDHLEGTITSRGTIHVMGSVKGRIEALRLHVADGARVDADAVVDEAVIAGEFVGNLTCRQRLEARPSGRLSGVIETYRVMLHEGAAFEGEVRMLPEPGRSGADTVRGSGHVRGGRAGSASDPVVTVAAQALPRTQPATPATPPMPATATSTATLPADRPAEPVAVAEPADEPGSSGRPTSADQALAAASAEAVHVLPRSSSPAGNGTRSGV